MITTRFTEAQYGLCRDSPLQTILSSAIVPKTTFSGFAHVKGGKSSSAGQLLRFMRKGNYQSPGPQYHTGI